MNDSHFSASFNPQVTFKHELVDTSISKNLLLNQNLLERMFCELFPNEHSFV